MLQPYATDALLDAVKRDAFLATSDENWSDYRILGVAHDVLLEQIAPRLKTTKQNWFQTLGSVTLVANQRSYDLPEEAMWSSVEALHLRNRTTGKIVAKLQEFYPQSVEMYQSDTPSQPTFFYPSQTQIVLQNSPDTTSVSTYDIQVSYYRRPAQLVRTTDICTVQSITGALTVSTSSQPAYFTTNAPDAYTSGLPYRVDVWNRLLPYTRKFGNLTCSAPSVTALTFNGTVTAAQVATIASGDIISVHGTTIFPDLSPETMPFLRRFTAAFILLSQGHATYQKYADRLEKDWETCLRGLGRRADGTVTKLSQYHSGAARMIGVRGGRWRS